MAHEPGPTRIGAAREQAAVAKILLAGGAVGVFGLALTLARTSHPAAGQAASSSSTQGASSALEQQQSGLGLGGGSIAPPQQTFAGPSGRTRTS
jgi:hypothetical protein